MQEDEEDKLGYIANGLNGIMAAGFAFPLLSGSGVLLAELLKHGFPASAPELLLGAVVYFFLVVLIAGPIVGMISGFIAIPLVWIVNMSLGSPMNRRTAVLSAGSLAGFMPTAFFVFLGPWIWITLLAMAMGAFGASWSAHRHPSNIWRRPITETKYQISIVRLMIGTAWIALVLATINFTGDSRLAIAAGVWLISNVLLLGLAKMYRRFRPIEE